MLKRLGGNFDAQFPRRRFASVTFRLTVPIEILEITPLLFEVNHDLY